MSLKVSASLINKYNVDAYWLIHLQEFDELLKETVIHKSTLSSKRVDKIIEISSQNLKLGQQHIVNSLLEVHKSNKANKVSSLYTLHALVQSSYSFIRKQKDKDNLWSALLLSIENILSDFFDISYHSLTYELKVSDIHCIYRRMLIMKCVQEKSLKVLKMWNSMEIFNKVLIEILTEKFLNSDITINDNDNDTDDNVNNNDNKGALIYFIFIFKYKCVNDLFKNFHSFL